MDNMEPVDSKAIVIAMRAIAEKRLRKEMGKNPAYKPSTSEQKAFDKAKKNWPGTC